MKNRSAIIVWSSLLLAACGIHLPPVPGPQPPQPPISTTRTATIAYTVRPGDVPQANCATSIETPFQPAIKQTTDIHGYTGFLVSFPDPDPGGALNAKATVNCPGFNPLVDSFVLAAKGNQDITFGGTVAAGNQPMLRQGPTPIEQPKPWETVTEAGLRAWRGSISTTLAPMPCGPRPNDPSNVMFTAQFDSSCWNADDRARAITAYTAKSWTHWPIGPIESHGYHGAFPDMSWVNNPDGFADRLEQLWNAGKIPVFFALPDTGFCADGAHIDRDCVEQRLTPIYTSPRYQALVRIAVAAWEPDYSSSDELWAAQWLARVFPHARRGIHLPSGHSAPCLGSELAEGGGTIPNEGACWAPIAPYIHFYLQQETWTFGGEAAPGRTGKQQFLYNLWDTSRRFAPGGSWAQAGADGKPIDVVAFEYASYYVTNDPSRASEADEWGDAAIAGAPFVDPVTGATIDTARYLSGYGDGGTVTPRPRSFSLTPSTSEPRRFLFSFTHSQR